MLREKSMFLGFWLRFWGARSDSACTVGTVGCFQESTEDLSSNEWSFGSVILCCPSVYDWKSVQQAGSALVVAKAFQGSRSFLVGPVPTLCAFPAISEGLESIPVPQIPQLSLALDAAWHFNGEGPSTVTIPLFHCVGLINVLIAWDDWIACQISLKNSTRKEF